MKDRFVSLNGTESKINELKLCLNRVETDFSELKHTLEHIRKIDFYAIGEFEADEYCQWIITVYLDIYDENEHPLRLIVDQTVVKNERKLGYDEWKEQRELDRPAALWDLGLVEAKWDCKQRGLSS